MVALALAVLALPLAGLRLQIAADTPLYHFAYLFDAAVVIAAVASLRIIRPRGMAPEAIAVLALIGLVAIALAVHPSARGAHFLVRLVEAVAIAVVTYRVLSGRDRRIVVGALAAIASLETAIAVAQVVAGGPVGLWALGEFGDPLTQWGGTVTPRGTLTGPFMLAALAMLVATTLVREALRSQAALWLAPAMIAVAPVGLSHSRTALVALALACACLAPGARRPGLHRWAIAALVLGTALPAASTWDGWSESAGRGAASDRGALVLQAAAIVSTSPLVGVGPGRYEDELRARPALRTTARVEPVHSVPLLFAAEAGIPSAIAATALVAALLLRAALRGATTLAVAAAFTPWLVLDQWAYTDPTGIALVALWSGLVLAGQTDAGAAPRIASRSAPIAAAAS